MCRVRVSFQTQKTVCDDPKKNLFEEQNKAESCQYGEGNSYWECLRIPYMAVKIVRLFEPSRSWEEENYILGRDHVHKENLVLQSIQ